MNDNTRHKTEPLLIPARILNEYIYCPRLAYLEWIQGEFIHNEYTVDGAIKHKRVDKPGVKPLDADADEERIHARSVALSSDDLGVTAVIDIVEGEGSCVRPVDYKRGKRPHVAGHVYQPERVQLCVQGLLLRDRGFECDAGFIYYVASREKVKVVFDAALISDTLEAIEALKRLAEDPEMPGPLEDSPKCPHCSLMGVCLPDEVRFMKQTGEPPRPVYAAAESGLPLYVQSPRAYIRKEGGRLIIEEKREKIAEARLSEVSQIVLFGASMMTTPTLHECFRRQIPVTYMSYGGWFLGHTVGTGHRNVETRIHQYRASFDKKDALDLARGWVSAKTANCRTFMRRNWRGDENGGKAPPDLMISMKAEIKKAARAESLPSLLGVEGAAAARYFGLFKKMIRSDDGKSLPFDFTRRNRRPPRDPINAMLSFAYAMLTREWTVALSAVGFDPYRGFFHRPRFGRPALALDMMEPFRPLIADSVVITVINNGEIKPDDFIHSAGGCNLKEGGRKRFVAAFERRMSQKVTHPLFGYRLSYRRLFEVQARLLARFLSGEIQEYPNFTTR